jgi:tetratricopeptide (TPR) repeat protein
MSRGDDLVLGDKQAFVAGLERQHGQRLRRFLASRLRHHIDPTADALNDVAEHLLDRHEYAQAVTILERAAALYPEVDYVQETLGKALEDSARADEALQAYRRALLLALEGESPYGDVGDYRRRIVDLERKLKR